MPIVIPGDGKSQRRRRIWPALALLLVLPLLLVVASTAQPIQIGQEHGLYLGDFGGRRARTWL